MPAPNGQRPDPNHRARLLLALIPEDVRKSASAAQLNERITEARTLAAQANDSRLDPFLRSQAKMPGQRRLAEADYPVRKAAPGQQPVARGQSAPVRKAKADELPKVYYDETGLPAIAVKPSSPDVMLIDQPEAQARKAGPAAAPAPAPARPRQQPAAAPATPEQVIKAMGPEWVPFRDWTGGVVGAVRKSQVTARIPEGAGGSYANAYDARRRRVGAARLADIVPLPGLQSGRRTGR